MDSNSLGKLVEERLLLAEHERNVLRAVILCNERVALDAEGLTLPIRNNRIHGSKSVPCGCAVHRSGDKRVVIRTRPRIDREGVLNPLGLEGSGDCVRSHSLLLYDTYSGLVGIERELMLDSD